MGAAPQTPVFRGGDSWVNYTPENQSPDSSGRSSTDTQSAFLHNPRCAVGSDKLNVVDGRRAGGRLIRLQEITSERAGG